MDISLSPELEKFVSDKVAGGQFDSASDVVRGALEVLKEQEALTSADIEELRPQVAKGIDQLERGEGAPWNVEEIKAEGRKRLSQNRKK